MGIFYDFNCERWMFWLYRILSNNSLFNEIVKEMNWLLLKVKENVKSVLFFLLYDLLLNEGRIFDNIIVLIFFLVWCSVSFFGLVYNSWFWKKRLYFENFLNVYLFLLFLK